MLEATSNSETIPDDAISLEDLLAAATVSDNLPASIEGVVIGSFRGHDESGRVLVDFSGNPNNGPLAASSTVLLDRREAGASLALMFEGGDPRRPIVMGRIVDPAENPSEASGEQLPVVDRAPLNVTVDDQRVVLTADKEIVLRCGRASITLTKAGKVLLRGAYVSSRSSGVNRIKGGSVQIN